MNAIEHNEFHRGWAAVAAHLPRPRAVLSVSAHCETQDAQVTAAALPATIHDFHGFPQALFDVRDPERVGLDPRRGLDHGAWNVLIAMYPAADLPVVQISMDTGRPGPHHYALARQLAPLRDEGVLVLASGNIVRNLVKLPNFLMSGCRARSR
jgi:4,5-DOPA dioxygenase extradiol